jgi:hypothetical protein
MRFQSLSQSRRCVSRWMAEASKAGDTWPESIKESGMNRSKNTSTMLPIGNHRDAESQVVRRGRHSRVD